MLTIATTPRPLEGEANRLAFRNATRSWEEIKPQPLIVVFGHVPADLMTSSMRMVLDFPQEPDGRPYFDAFINITEQLAPDSTVMYATDHLIFLPGLGEAIKAVCARFDQFLLTGRRWEVHLHQPINFADPDWPASLNAEIQSTQALGTVAAKDWLVWRKPFPRPIPPFIMGIPWYDSWMVVRAEELGFPRINATEAVKAVHPHHGFPFPGGIQGRKRDPRWEQNHQLALGCEGRGRIDRLEWTLEQGIVVKRGNV